MHAADVVEHLAFELSFPRTTEELRRFHAQLDALVHCLGRLLPLEAVGLRREQSGPVGIVALR